MYCVGMVGKNIKKYNFTYRFSQEIIFAQLIHLVCEIIMILRADFNALF